MSATDRHLLVAFPGRELSAEAAALVRDHDVAGVTLFFHHNAGPAAGIRALTDALQRASGAGPPLLVAADQEGGQFLALGPDTTPFAGNMALGAAGDPDLTRRVAEAIGTELRALGVDVAYAPVADLASNPRNPAMGIRSFGDDPRAVATHVAAFVDGLARRGVAATLKHFPGTGDVEDDPHHGLATVARSREEHEDRELAPFRAGIAAGAPVVMSGHHATPGLTGRDDLPSTLSRAVMHRLLREELGFTGVAVTDALDMHALAQGEGQLVDAVAALRAGNDLLLCPPDLAVVHRLRDGLRLAARRGLLDPAALELSRARIDRLRRWVATADRPDVDVVGGREHRALADELARRAVTLVRDDAGLLPLRPGPDDAVLAVMPQPSDLTPADTSSAVPPGLAAALRGRYPRVTETVVAATPSERQIAAIRAAARDHAVAVIGTLAADRVPAQAELVAAVLATGTPTITVALRTPWDLAAYPDAPTHLCTYGHHAPSLAALAHALATGEHPGRLPVATP